LHRDRFWNYEKLFNLYESIYRELKYCDTSINQQMDKDKVGPEQWQKEYEKRMRNSPQYRIAVRYLSSEANKHFVMNKIQDIQFMYVAAILPDIRNKTNDKNYQATVFPTIAIENEH
jgi:hypothetical protein